MFYYKFNTQLLHIIAVFCIVDGKHIVERVFSVYSNVITSWFECLCEYFEI